MSLGFIKSLIVGIVLLGHSPASADPVSLQVGNNDVSGQGWLFKDPVTGFCGVVTAAHVAAPRGVRGPILIRTKSGVEGVGAGVSVLSPEAGESDGPSFDVALMRVEGPISERGCTSSTLGRSGERYMLSRSRRGLLSEVSNGGETTLQEVEFLASGTADERRLALRPKRPGDVVSQGMSGSVVTEVEDDRVSVGTKPLPLAMITSVEGTTAAAVRFDVIRDLASAALRRQAAPSIGAGGLWVISWNGETTDVRCPGLNASSPSAACGWRARIPAGQRAASLILNAAGHHVASLSVSITPASEAHRVILEALADGATEDWRFVKAVQTASGSAELRFPQIEAQKLRVSIAGSSGTSFEIRITTRES